MLEIDVEILMRIIIETCDQIKPKKREITQRKSVYILQNPELAEFRTARNQLRRAYQRMRKQKREANCIAEKEGAKYVKRGSSFMTRVGHINQKIEEKEKA